MTRNKSIDTLKTIDAGTGGRGFSLGSAGTGAAQPRFIHFKDAYHQGVTVSNAKVIKMRALCRVDTDTTPSYPGVEFTGWGSASTSVASWHANYYKASSLSVDSAPTSWFNTHNVSGRTLRFGYIGASNSWYVGAGGVVTFEIDLYRLDANNTIVREHHYANHRDAEYPLEFTSSLIIPQKIEDLTAVDFTVSGQLITGVIELMQYQ